MKIIKHFVQFILVWMIVCSSESFAQQTNDWQLEKMPPALETDYALSALPPHLRAGATVYLLDPTKGYYMARKGTNGFSAFVERTDWSRGEFLPDMYAPEGFDAIGSKTLMPIFFEIAAMRASGKYTAKEIREIVVKRVKKGIYKAPPGAGICYMLSPLLRTNNGEGVENAVMPHYMFYAPYLDNAEIGGGWIEGGHQPFIISTGDALDQAHSIFNYIGIAAGETEKAKIVEDNKELLARLAAYKPYLKVDLNDSMNHNE
ncbi:MAG TPA: hypothetical protein VMU83_04925 [Hanamia sp.]|nr:hypothetical protein [Hanamia sp.]